MGNLGETAQQHKNFPCRDIVPASLWLETKQVIKEPV